MRSEKKWSHMATVIFLKSFSGQNLLKSDTWYVMLPTNSVLKKTWFAGYQVVVSLVYKKDRKCLISFSILMLKQSKTLSCMKY